ncbi:hypothetical protein BgiMline_010558 [Biomphalaria glabrata]|uniref:Uncharacterized protein LOC106072047 n=1 Tax=Biomphalaria glabrata TaxID=6526 RepID=A0A9U8EHB3_BIOGL|nr:uncharacterized protein LOC106072047 [Biomphalaria glabrata]KAI8739718.1 putative nuclear protein localization protein 4 [Biomphalaria glabrata]KAI8771986.1 nuclear protein localization protein 4 [Biomphalaria glabrata]
MSKVQEKIQTAKNLEEVDSFKKQAWKDYDRLYAELEFTCQRAAMMHQHEASRYDRKSYYIESAAEIVGGSSVVSGVVGVLKNKMNLLTSRTGLAAVVGLPLATGLEFLGKGKGTALPTLHDKAEKHKNSAAGWQRLARLTQSYRILMDDPRYDAVQYAQWYKELVDTQQSIATIVEVPDSIVELFDDPVEVIKPLRKNKRLFQRYMKLQDNKDEAHEGGDA